MLIIEDGTGKVDAQSYATAAELVAFAASRLITIPATQPEQEALLLKAMDYMESLNYKGARYSVEQALMWPRSGVVIDGWSYGYEDMPIQLKAAQVQLAVDTITVDLMPTIIASEKGAVTEETVEGAVSVKYAAPSAILGGVGVTATGDQMTRAASFLHPLLRSFAQLRVGRA